MLERLIEDLNTSTPVYDVASRLHPGQRLIAHDPARFKLLCCGRKWGKTDFAAELLNNDLRQGKWVASLAPAYKTTRAIWEYLKPRLPADANVNEGSLKIKLPNGGTYTGWSLDTTAADSVRPFEYDTLVIDEAAFVPGLYSKWTEILLPTLTKRKGSAYFLSTPCGFNDFFKLYQMGQDPDEALWQSWKFPTVGHAYGNPHIDPDEIAMQQKLLPSRSFSQEYMASFEEDAGAIYDNFDATLDTGNVSYEAEYNPDLPVVWGVDDGYVYGDGPGSASYHPRMILFGQFTSRGGLNVFDEYYATGEVEEISLQNATAKGYPLPSIAYVDSSAAQLKARIWGMGIQTFGATHKVNEGIKNVRRLICDGQGQRLLKFHPRCKVSIREHQTYRYDTQGAGGEPKPLKVDDHSCFVAGTLIETDRGQVAIEELKAGDKVLTRDGYQTIRACGQTDVAPVITVTINDIYSLTGTPNHPVYTDNRGWINLSELGNDDIILVSNSVKDHASCPRELYQKSRPLSTTELHSAVTLNQPARLNAIILNPTASTFAMVSNRSIEKSGKQSAALSLMDTIFITWTKTRATTVSLISRVFPQRSITKFMLRACQNRGVKSFVTAWKTFALLPKNGTPAQKASNGTGSTPSTQDSQNASLWNILASSVERLLNPLSLLTSASAPTIANLPIGARQALTTKPANALIVGKTSHATNTASRNAAQLHVVDITVGVNDNPQIVYNLSINAAPEYFANGVLVHNCDTVRYACHALRFEQ